MRRLVMGPRHFFAAPPIVSLRRWLLLACLLLAGGAPGRAPTDAPDNIRLPPAPLHEQVLNLPGDPARPVMPQVTLYTPSGPRPFPLAVMHHGAPDASDSKPGKRYRFTFSADYFLSRGYAVALPISPFAPCDAVKVAGTALEYTPARGFTGNDLLAFEVVEPDGRQRVYRVALLVR